MATLPIPPTPPQPPSDYTAPSPTGTVVTSYAELAAEMALAGPRVIVVADGVYTGAGLQTAQGHHIWAQRRGAVTFEFGIGFRGNGGVPGGSLHGIVFDVDDLANVDPTALLNEAIVNTWDSVAPLTIGSNLVIEDCEFDGNGVVGSGIQATSPSGLTVRRCVLRNFIDVGISAFRNGSGPDDFDTIILEDLVVEGVSRPVPGSAGGLNAEVGLYLGHRFELRRFAIRDCAWAGVGVINGVSGWTIEDGDIDRVGWGYFEGGSVGLYCEHCHDGDIRRMRFGMHQKVGINCEWNQDNADPHQNSLVPRNHTIRIEDAHIQAYKVGIGFDLAVANCTVRRCRIERAWLAGALDNNTFPDDNGDFPPPDGFPAIETTNAVDIESCSFLLHPSVPLVLHDHHGTASLPPTVPGWPLSPAEVDPALLTLTAFGRMGELAALLQSRMPTMLRRAPQARAVAQWLAEQLSEAHEAIVSAHAPLSEATAVQLDKHGAGLMRPRAGLSDDEYRLELQVKAAALFRTRSPELAVDLLRLLTTDSPSSGSFQEWPPAAYEYTLEDIDGPTAARWESLLRTAKPEGVRMQTRVVEDAANAFRFDSGPGYDEGLYAYTLES